MAKIRTAALEFNDPNGTLAAIVSASSFSPMALFAEAMRNPSPLQPYKEPVYQEPTVNEPTMMISFYEPDDPKAWWIRTKRTDYHCPCCGQKQVVHDVNEKDYGDEPGASVWEHYCLNCFYSWEMGAEETRTFIARTLLPAVNEDQRERTT